MKLRLVAIALLLAACGGARSPDGAVRALAEAAEAGDRDAVYALLGPATRARLATDAERAAQAAGRREIGPVGSVREHRRSKRRRVPRRWLVRASFKPGEQVEIRWR